MDWNADTQTNIQPQTFIIYDFGVFTIITIPYIGK